MPTEKETLYIAFSTQKGGAGKTTLTVLAASYLHYVKGLNVAVVDCDYPQHSIAEMRKRDLRTVMEDEHYKAMAYRQLQRIGKKAYPVVEGTAENAVEKAEGLLEKLPGIDIVFFDLPGTVNSGGVLRTLANMDYIFSPIAADRGAGRAGHVPARQQTLPQGTDGGTQGGIPLDAVPGGRHARQGEPYPGDNGRDTHHYREVAMGERKKISLTELDESSIVASFKEEQPALAVPPTVEPETPVPRQTEQPDIKPAHESEYLRLFIHESPVCARLGKTIYLRKEFHERIQRIVQTIGGNRVSLFSYTIIYDNLYHAMRRGLPALDCCLPSV